MPGEYRDTLSLDLPRGTWRLWWVEPVSGKEIRAESVRHDGGRLAVETPAYRVDIALAIRPR